MGAESLRETLSDSQWRPQLPQSRKGEWEASRLPSSSVIQCPPWSATAGHTASQALPRRGAAPGGQVLGEGGGQGRGGTLELHPLQVLWQQHCCVSFLVSFPHEMTASVQPGLQPRELPGITGYPHQSPYRTRSFLPRSCQLGREGTSSRCFRGRKYSL